MDDLSGLRGLWTDVPEVSSAHSSPPYHSPEERGLPVLDGYVDVWYDQMMVLDRVGHCDCHREIWWLLRNCLLPSVVAVRPFPDNDRMFGVNPVAGSSGIMHRFLPFSLK